MGRTARQGNVGSYSMVLAIEPLLEQLHLPAAAVAHRYADLSMERIKLFEMAYEDRKAMVSLLQTEHEKTEKFVENLLANRTEACRTMLREWITPQDGAAGGRAGGAGVAGGAGDLCSRTLVLVDGTSSMGSLFQASKTAIHTMFERASEVLREAHVAVRFEMQIGVYRNYSSGAMKLFLCSPWTSDAKVLFEFLSRIAVDGGQGNEAIEIGLAHANTEQSNGAKISQVLVLGDAIPNTIKEVEMKRRIAGVDWTKTPYKTPTNSKSELQLLAAAGIPVFGFYVLPRVVLPHVADTVRKGFEELAQLGAPGGRAELLNVNDSDGAARLTDQVTCQVLNDVERLGGSGVGGVGGGGAGSLASLYAQLFKGGNVANK